MIINIINKYFSTRGIRVQFLNNNIFINGEFIGDYKEVLRLDNQGYEINIYGFERTRIVNEIDFEKISRVIWQMVQVFEQYRIKEEISKY